MISLAKHPLRCSITRAKAGESMRYIVAGLLFLCAFPLSAAEITREPLEGDTDLISVTGVLNEGDEIVFRNVAAAPNKALVFLNSEGGDLKAGIEIGRAIRLRNFATAVPPGTLCASACALTWLAGSPRMLEATSNLGFHAAYRVIDGKATESGVANALVGAYLNQLGLPDTAIAYVTSAPPEGIEWLTPAKAQGVGIAYDTVQLDAADAASDDGKTFPYDPMGTVTAFYSALAVADGETASALVIPEKRGKGPFNEASIHAFFGAMSQPLKLTGTALRGDNDVRVSYEYVTRDGRRCQGRADVQTTYAFGKTLVSKITALDGC
ncbi:crotonase/enoyl-CoA hydratase family protein [Rhizobium sp. Kim5]|nr:crotonase/enoyl-CoA hydratase family protein [Rhizobium sp. Kim5]